MGLGGITRDSILDLQALVHDDNNNNDQQLSGSFNSGKKNDFSSLLNEPPPDLLDNNNSNEGGTLKRVESFKEPLNDTPLTSPAVAGMTNSIDGLLLNSNGIPTSPSAGLSSLPPTAATSSNTNNNFNRTTNNNHNQQKQKKKNVSSTNSRSLDSYNTNTKNNYSNFQYEGYTDYYNESEYGSGGYGYGYDDYKNSLRDNSKKEGGREGSPGSNLLSCLFPWIGTPKQDEQRKIIDTQQSNSSSSDGSISLPSSLKEAELDKEEARQHAVNEEAAAQSAAAAAGLSTLPTSATTSPSSPKIPMKQIQSPTSSRNKPPTPGREVSFAKSMSPPKATIPHMMSVDSTSTAHSTSTSSAEDLTAAGILVGESIVEDEKKQEEGDNTAVLPTNFPKVPDLDKDTATSTITAAEQLAKEAEKEELPQFKSILKVRRCSISLLNANSNNKPGKTTTKKDDGKRHFLPTYEPKKSPVHSMTGDPINNNTNPKYSINFNPMARVLTIPSRKDIPLHQKAQVWWQRSDYDEFKKTGRIISKAMECGGSEIWLASSNAWGKAGAKRGSNGNSGNGSPRKVQGTPGTQSEGETKLERSNSDSSKSSQSELEKSEIEYNKSLSRYVKEDTDSDGEGADNPNKWWCKFGHSRRGLEHIASSSEGRARQQSVLLAIRMVMEEQKRQRASRTKDPNKLRNVSMQYTSWARDLSLAAGAADHEAVESGFDPQASDRARHFAKRISNFGSTQDESSGMLTHSHKVAVAVTSQILDANTHATPRTTARKKAAQTKSLGDIAAADSDTTSLSKRAKGYIPGGNDTSAAEMMAGMGSPQHRRSVKV